MPGRSGGDGTYTRCLIEHLAKIDRVNHYYLFVAPYNREWFAVNQPNFHLVLCPIPNSFSLRVLWEHSILALAANRMRLDVFHGPVNITPMLLQIPSIVTVHDAVYTGKEARIPLLIRLYWGYIRPRTAARARRIIVVSETHRRDLMEIGAAPEDRIEVIYNAVHERFQPLDRVVCRAAAQEKFGIDRPFVLWVGRPYDLKNLVRLVEGFAQFNKRMGLKYDLVMAGPSGWEDAAVREVISRHNLMSFVHQLGYVDNDRLPQLYNAAEALLFPSLKESFGFPIVEAMACGTPVVASNVSAMPEILGGAGELVDPLRVDAIAAGLEAVLCNPKRWEECRRSGLQRAKLFTWKENARRTIDIYRRVAESVA